MPKWISFVLALFFSVAVYNNLHAQALDDIINNHVNAIGGKEKLSKLQSLHTEGVAVSPNGAEIITVVNKVQDKLFRTDVSFGMGNVIILLTDKGGWASNPRSNGAFEPMPAETVKNQQFQLDIAGPLVDYAAKGHKAELLGKETINGTECYKVKLTLKTGQEINYFIDSKTWYVVRDTRKGGGGMFGGGRPAGGGGNNADTEFVTDYSDFKKTEDGYVFAWTVKRGGMGGAMTYEKIEVNKPVDEKLFKAQ